MTTFVDLKNAVESARTVREERLNKIAADIGATVDKNGRLHAPHDGFFYAEKQWYGGEYLPEITIDGEEFNSATVSIKIKIASSLVEDFKGLFSGDIGKVWSQNGIEVAYFYANVFKFEKTIVEKLLPDSGKKLILAENASSNCGKAFEFKMASIIRKCVNAYGYDWLDFFGEIMAMDYNGVPFELFTKKDGKLTYKSSWDKKMVCYQYLDGTIYS